MFYDLPAVDGNALPVDLALARRKATLRRSLGGSASLMCEVPEGFLQPPEQPLPRACATLDPEQGWGAAPGGLCVNCSSAVGSAPPTPRSAVQLCFLFSRH